MTTFTIIEAQNVNSVRDGVTVELNSLSAAKRYATKNQSFFGTALIIEVDGVRVAQKSHEKGAKWVNL